MGKAGGEAVMKFVFILLAGLAGAVQEKKLPVPEASALKEPENQGLTRDLPAMFNDLSAASKASIKDDFAAVGIEMKALYITSISPTEDTQFSSRHCFTYRHSLPARCGRNSSRHCRSRWWTISRRCGRPASASATYRRERPPRPRPSTASAPSPNCSPTSLSCSWWNKAGSISTSR